MLDARARKTLTFDKMCSLVRDPSETFTTERYTLKRQATSVSTVREVKRYRAINEKGVTEQNYVYPYGYLPPDDDNDSPSSASSTSE